MHVVRHNDPGMQVVVPEFGAVLNRGQHQLGDRRLFEKCWPAAGLIEQTVHADKGLARGYIWGRKMTGRR